MNFESRKNVLKYDDVMSRQREVVYGERREVLEGADLQDQVQQMIKDAVATYVNAATEGFPEEWDLEALWSALGTLYPISLRHQTLEAEAGGRDGLERETLLEALQADALAAYEAREGEVGAEVMRELERRVMLSVLDRKWREHLYEMDYLREGIGLRAYSQRDPLVEYQREGFDMFNAMKEGIREETVGFLFHLEVQVDDEEPEAAEAELLAPAAVGAPVEPHEHAPVIRAKGLEAPRAPQKLAYSAPSEDGEVEVKGTPASNADDEFANTGRNADCPCGSGKKYKKCHGAPGGPTGLTTRVNG
jgi:preprotein translocase subunit SecA